MGNPGIHGSVLLSDPLGGLPEPFPGASSPVGLASLFKTKTRTEELLRALNSKWLAVFPDTCPCANISKLGDSVQQLQSGGLHKQEEDFAQESLGIQERESSDCNNYSLALCIYFFF